MWDSHGIAVKLVAHVWMMAGLWEARFSLRCRESLWAVEQAVVIDAVSPAILFTFSPLLYCIFTHFFLCTQWAEAHSRRSVTHCAGNHAHAHMDSHTKLTANMCRNIFVAKWIHSLYSWEMVSALSWYIVHILNHSICTVTTFFLITCEIL